MSTVATQLSLAIEKHESGGLPEAERLYRQVIGQEPNQSDALNWLGVICGQTGRTDQAVQYLRKALKARPKSARARNDLADALRDSEKLDDTIEHYRVVVELHPQIAAVWCNLGAALRATGRLYNSSVGRYRGYEKHLGLLKEALGTA